MVQKEVTVGLKDGMVARPVAMFVQIAGKYQSQVLVVYNGIRVNAKSIMGMMSLGIAKGESLTIITEGADEEEAAKGLADYLTSGE